MTAKKKAAKAVNAKLSDGLWKEDLPVAEDQSTKIIYKKLPGNMVMIIGFKNFMTADEIKRKYGDDVAEAYHVNSDSMAMSFLSNGDNTLEIPFGDRFVKHINIGDFYSDDEFSKIVSSVRKCGNALHEIVVAFNTDDNVKEIKI